MILTDRSLQPTITARNSSTMPVALRGTYRSTEADHLPPIIKANSNVFHSSNAGHGEYDFRKMYEKWRTGLSEYQVARLCRLDHQVHTRLPALPEAVKNVNGSGGNKRRLSQHSASSPPVFRLKVTGENGTAHPGPPANAFKNDAKFQPPHSTHTQRKPLAPRSSKPPANRIGRFDSIVRIGNGSYGNVFRCFDRDTGTTVAVKRFLETEDNPTIRKVASREIRTLKLLRHPNIVTLLEVFRRKKRFHLIFEYCDQSLLDEIQTTRNGLPEANVQSIIAQLLQALRFLHSKNFIHRDVKPENILLTTYSVVKLCDFGFVRELHSDKENEDDSGYTEYVATRWYRAPELLTTTVKYGTGIDIWATGCVFYECLTRLPLLPGATDIDQLHLIQSMFDQDPAQDRHRQRQSRLSTGSELSDDEMFPQDQPKQTPEWEKRLAKVNDLGKEVFRMMLQVDSTRRPSASQLLQLPYFGLEHGINTKKATNGRLQSGVSKSDPSLNSHKPGSYHPLQLPALPATKHAPKSSVSYVSHLAVPD